MTSPGEPEKGRTAQPMFESGTEWLRGAGDASDVVLSSRVRLARNLAGVPFVHRADPEQLRRVVDNCRGALLGAALGERTLWVDLHESPALERQLLVERHLVSALLAQGQRKRGVKDAEWPRALAVGMPGERASVMVNEEDHLRLQVIHSGLALDAAYEEIDAFDDRVGAALDYAFSPRLGFLTACPTNVGTGIRVSVMLHLPGLKMTGEIEKVRAAAAAMSLAVRGFYGEGSDASGDFYQISNQTTLGKSERDLLAEMRDRIVPQVVRYERESRANLMRKRRGALEDGVMRAYGVLRHARLLSTEEAMKLLSLLRLGVALGLTPGIEMRSVHHLMLVTQPAHLQRVLGEDMDQERRRSARAALVRKRLGGC